MKHKHCDMIVAKARETDLVVFAKGREGWIEVGCMPGWGDDEYFLCHRDHADICLYWLNGGVVEYLTTIPEYAYPLMWFESDRAADFSREWSDSHALMHSDSQIRIKKTKRWGVLIRKGGKEQIIAVCSSEEEAEEVYKGECQIVEFEVAPWES